MAKTEPKGLFVCWQLTVLAQLHKVPRSQPRHERSKRFTCLPACGMKKIQVLFWSGFFGSRWLVSPVPPTWHPSKGKPFDRQKSLLWPSARDPEPHRPRSRSHRTWLCTELAEMSVPEEYALYSALSCIQLSYKQIQEHHFVACVCLRVFLLR